MQAVRRSYKDAEHLDDSNETVSVAYQEATEAIIARLRALEASPDEWASLATGFFARLCASDSDYAGQVLDQLASAFPGDAPAAKLVAELKRRRQQAVA